MRDVAYAVVLWASTVSTGALCLGRGAESDLGTFTLTCLPMRDVGGGNGLAIVLRTPTGRVYLYDTGNGYPTENGWRGNYNAGRDTIWPYLQSNGVRSIHGVFISHAHYDHFGGLLWLAEHVPIGQLIDSGYRFDGRMDESYRRELQDYERLRARFRKQGKYRKATAGAKLSIDPHLEVQVLAPPEEYFGDPVPEKRPPNDPPAHYLVNANSLVLRIRHGDVVFLLPGDIQRLDQEHSLLPFVPAEALRCDVLVAPGHGLHVTKAFAQRTRPKLVLASVLRRFARGLEARRRFEPSGARVLVTSTDGLISVRSNGHRFSFQATERAPFTQPNEEKTGR